MPRVNHQALKFGWAEEIKKLSEAGDHAGVAQLVDMIQNHVDQIGVFDRHWVGVINGASMRSIPVTLTKGQALRLFREQEGRCALTGLPISFRPDTYVPGRKYSGSASLDRIDASDSYRLGNVWWVHREVNIMKGALPMERFRELCRLVAIQQAGGPAIAPAASADHSIAHIAEPPKAVSTVAWFLRSCCEDDPHGCEWSSNLWARFETWLRQADVPPCTQTAFGRALRSLGYHSVKGRHIRWHGLRLLPCEGGEVKNTRASDPRTANRFYTPRT